MPAWKKGIISGRLSSTCRNDCAGDDLLTKAIAIVLLLAMIAHLIKPIGLPGLKKRGDFWKIAVFAFIAMMSVVVIQM